MTRILLLCAAAAAALTVAACGKKTEQARETPPATAAVSAVQDAAAVPVGQASASTMGSHDTPAFVSNAGQSDMYEIEAGKLAETKGASPDVKAFGKMMVANHTAMSAEMKPLIAAAGQTPPAKLDERRQGLIDNLKSAGPADFDKVYLNQQVAAHEEALTLMKGYADNGEDAGLKAGRPRPCRWSRCTSTRSRRSPTRRSRLSDVSN